MNEIKDKDLDSFIFSSTYERYKRNILKDREDKTLGQWSFDEEKINNLKWEMDGNNCPVFDFWLHKGTYATSLLREIMKSGDMKVY